MVAEEDAGSNTSDDEAGMSSGDSGLLKDINENHKNDIKDSRFQENREKDINNEERQSSSSTTNHSGKYLNEGEKPYFNNKGGDHQSDLSALQKLYSLESMQRFAESSPVFPTREPYPGLPNYDKPLMIDVGPGRSFTGSTRMPTSMDTNRGESDKVKKKAVVREAVDPAKYVRIQDLEGIKFACSKCGNTYKWRKSLNKHWKEKHDGEIPTAHGQNLITLNIPQVKGKTTNINTALFSYAPLGAPPQGSAAGFSGTGMPTVAGKFKEKDPTYPSAEILSKYEELSKQWMNFANAAAAASSSNFRGSNDGRYSQKNVENHNNKRPSSPDGKLRSLLLNVARQMQRFLEAGLKRLGRLQTAWTCHLPQPQQLLLKTPSSWQHLLLHIPRATEQSLTNLTKQLHLISPKAPNLLDPIQPNLEFLISPLAMSKDPSLTKCWTSPVDILPHLQSNGKPTLNTTRKPQVPTGVLFALTHSTQLLISTSTLQFSISM